MTKNKYVYSPKSKPAFTPIQQKMSRVPIAYSAIDNYRP